MPSLWVVASSLGGFHFVWEVLFEGTFLVSLFFSPGNQKDAVPFRRFPARQTHMDQIRES